MIMHVGAAPGAIGKRLRHVGRHRTIFRSHLGSHHFEKRVTISGGQGIGVLEIHFILTVRVFVVRLISAPTQLVAITNDLLQIAQRG